MKFLPLLFVVLIVASLEVVALVGEEKPQQQLILDRAQSGQPVDIAGDVHVRGNQVLRCLVAATVAPNVQRLLEQLWEENVVDIWSQRIVGDSWTVDVRVPSEASLFSALAKISPSSSSSELHEWMKCSVWIPNVEERIASERQGRPANNWNFVQLDRDVDFLASGSGVAQEGVGDGLGFFYDYRTFDQLMEYVELLAKEHGDIARFVPAIATTEQGRNISVVHVTAPSGSDSTSHGTKKPVIWFNGGIHAREWISSHTAVFVLQQLLTGYGKDAEVTHLLETFEIVMSPHINPDGYEYSRLQDRMWRKNRRSNGRLTAIGVDLNRNFDVHWADGGSSRSPYSDTYRGPSPASEPEVAGLQAYIGKLKTAVVGIDFHSYGQLLLRPYGFTMDDHPQEKRNRKWGDGMRNVIKSFSGTDYTSQKSAGLYPVSGGFDDWMTVQGMTGFTIELRDRGQYGFVLPRDQIIPTGKEIWEAFRFLCKQVEQDLF